MSRLVTSMAQPFRPHRNEYIPLENKKRKKVFSYTKGTEFILLSIASICFTLSIKDSECTVKEAFISGVFGVLFAYATIALLIPICLQRKIEILILNVLSFLMLIVIGYVLFATWHEQHKHLTNNYFHLSSSKYLFVSTVLLFLSAIVFLTEVVTEMMYKF